MNEERVLALIDSVYEAAVDPARWTAFLERLSLAIQGRWTMLIAHESRTTRASFPLSIGIDPLAVKRAQELIPRDPSIARAEPLLRAGAVFTGESLISGQELVRTAMYNEVLRPNDLHHVITCAVTGNENEAALISSVRPSRLGPFGRSEIRLFEALHPHLRRALQIQQRLAVTEGQREALDRTPAGCVLLNSGGRILAANRAAEQIFRRDDGISAFGGQLYAAASPANAKLRECIHGVVFGLSMQHAGGVVAVPRLNATQPYTVLAAPLPKKPMDWGGCNPAAIVFIADPTPPTKIEFILRALYHLTPAEARLACVLANGEGLTRAAEELGISNNTAKAQLQQIFGKTQTRRQAELVRLLTTVTWNTKFSE